MSRLDDIRTLARATAFLGYRVERTGQISGLEYLEIVEGAGRHPLLGFGAMAEVAAKLGINYLDAALMDILSDLSGDPPKETTDEEEAAYRVEYMKALRAAEGAYIKVSEAAEMLDRTPLRVRQLIHEGKLVGERRGHLWWVNRDSVEDYLAERDAE